MFSNKPVQKSIRILAVSVSLLALIIAMFIVDQPSTQSITSNPIPTPIEQPPTQLLSAAIEPLPVVGSKENLYQMVKKAYKENKRPWYIGIFDRVGVQEDTSSGMAEMAESDTQVSFEKSMATDYSGTNVQIEGVDEADTLKTDGTYLYQLGHTHNGQGRLLISKVFPVEEMEIIKEIVFEEDSFYPHLLYLDEKDLVVIGQKHLPYTIFEQQSKDINPEASVSKKLIGPIYDTSLTKAYVYNISDIENIQLTREIEIEGNYVSSRKIDKDIYIITNQYLRYMDYSSNKLLDDIATPAYRDTAVANDYQTVDYNELYYFPDPDMNYLNVAGFSLDRPEQPADITSYLGGGQEIYGSKENLFVTITRYNHSEIESRTSTSDTASVASSAAPRGYYESTDIYKFSWSAGRTELVAQGTVPGRILNQFSMDEYDGYFRIATTYGDSWREDEFRSENLLFILDQQLDVVGSIGNIAPGEQIYSARFMGDRGYIVTFKTTDPLFVLDLEDPTQPAILGELKIPGFSNYLHPYDEHHLIGFGRDTVEFTEKDGLGNSREIAIQKGIKMSLFDVTNENEPKEKFVEIIGDRGTYSELDYNHKALLFSKAKNIFAFPIEVAEAKQAYSQQTNPFHVQTEFTYQGAYIYGIDPERGFQLKGRITHLSDKELKTNPWEHYERFINRIIYIEDTLYTVSNGRIQANDLHSLELLETLDLK